MSQTHAEKLADVQVDSCGEHNPASKTYWNRAVGIETEFGILDLNNPKVDPVRLSVDAALAVAKVFSTGSDNSPIRWDYGGEDPLNDMRGMRIERALAHPSLLTDDPQAFAPSGQSQVTSGPLTADLNAAVSPLMTTVLCPNGARFYVDHAHPEYSSPELLTARDAARWDQGGDEIARRAMEVLNGSDRQVVLYKNNTDSKGSAYGAHENYQILRELPFKELTKLLIPFLATRPIICGAGRVGLGQNSEDPGFQISQRADFVADIVGLQTTFNRPIVNTRDEPHASSRWRRLHVINGDANRFEFSAYLKMASMRCVLWAVEAKWLSAGQMPNSLLALALRGDPVEAVWQISRDLFFKESFECQDGKYRSSWQLQWDFCQAVAEIGKELQMPEDIAQEWHDWAQTLKMLQHDRDKCASRVEWLAKYNLLEALRERLGSDWQDPKLLALDLRWADLRSGASPVDKLVSRGAVQTLSSCEQIVHAADNPPCNTRAALRARAIEKLSILRAASWKSLVVAQKDEKSGEKLWRITLGDPQISPDLEVLEGMTDKKVIEMLSRGQADSKSEGE